MNQHTPLLSVNGLSIKYGRSFSLKNISFDLLPGEVVGLIGPNGSGKTTLMEGLVGLLPADERAVLNDGRDVPAHKLKDYFFYVPDGIRPYPTLDVDKVLGFYKKTFGRSCEDLEKIISQLELNNVLNKRTGQLSKGYLRRVLLAIGLISSQPILILDEPLDGFDVKQLQKIVPLLRDEAKRGRTLFVCIHQLSDAERICDRFLLLKDGSLIAQGKKQDLLKQADLTTGSLEEVFLGLA